MMKKDGLVQSARFDINEAARMVEIAQVLGIKNAELIRRAVEVFACAMNGEEFQFILEFNKKKYDACKAEKRVSNG